MVDNPLKQYFRQPALYMRLPTKGKWYEQTEVEYNDSAEVAVYGISAMDEIMLNTPDAMLNGIALENVIKHCVPDVKDVKKLMVPDIENIFLALKVATNDGKHEIDRNCPNCEHENRFEINCGAILDTTEFVKDEDCEIKFGTDLIVRVKPYTFDMRQLYVKKQLEEDKALRMLNDEDTLDEFDRARIIAESVERMSTMTFSLVGRSIDEIELIKAGTKVTDTDQINEWLLNINKSQADVIIEAVNKLNSVGADRRAPAKCEKCGHEWTETLSFDPVSFFGRRSRPGTLNR